jgi:beta-glucosidase
MRVCLSTRIRSRFAIAAFTAASVALLGWVGASSPARADTQCPWMDASQTPDQRAQALLAAMSIDDKVLLVHGGGSGGGVGNVAANPTLCIPALALNDGPEGVGNGKTGVTAFPAPLGMAATWDPALVRRAGQANGLEHWGKGSNVWLGPGMNIARVPLNGRNFEYFGEDPYLAGQAAAAEIRGAQEDNPGQPVVATAKHYALNNQEDGRNSFSMDADARTTHEIYLPAFEASVKQGHVGAVMCAYNRIDGVYACENPTTQNTYLKGEFGFDGWIMSDWGATHSTVNSALAGLDMEMPSSTYFGSALKTAVQGGQVPAARLDDMALRILRTMFRLGLFDHPPGAPQANVSTPDHVVLARTLSEEGSVLLKNQGAALPLTGGGKSIAVIGQTASNTASGTNANNVCTGGGSAAVKCTPVTPLQAIQQRAAAAGDTVTYDDGTNVATAAAAAAQANVAIVFTYYTESEGTDRANLALDGNGNALISAVAGANPNTIVALNTGGPVLMPWLDQVPAVLETWYPGVENGDAVAGLLFGDVNPSGKLPETFPQSETDLPTAGSPQQYPGVPGPDGNVHATYSEGLLVGYRWYDARGIQPLFCFGHGLSYTSFAYSGLTVSPSSATTATASFTVRNAGSRAGAEVAQVYVGDPPAAGEPPKQLKGFQRVFLQPGQSQQVTISLDQRAFSYWDTGRGWTIAPGTYHVYVGGSSCDLRLQADVFMPHAADLSLTKTGSPNPVKRDKPLTYTLSVHNAGPLAASGVTVTDPLPRKFDLRSRTTSQGTCSAAKASEVTTVTCQLGSLTSGATATITIVARATTKGTVTNTATAKASSPDDPDPTNNTASATTVVTG